MSEETNTDTGGNNGGSGGPVEKPAWMSSLPDAYKQHEGFAQFKEPSEAWGKFDALLKAEQSMITIPGKDATPEEVAAFYAKLGRPEKPEGYEITKPADLPEGVSFDENGLNEFLKFAHDNHLTKEQTQKLYGWYVDLAKNGYAADAKSKADAKAKEEAEATRIRTEAIDKLKTAWGNNFEANKNIAVSEGFKKFTLNDPEAVALFENAKIDGVPLGDHPVFMKLFYEIGKATMSDTTGGRGGGSGTSGDSEAETAKKMFPSMNKK